MKTKSCAKKHKAAKKKKPAFRPTSKKDREKQKQAEEFWSDPCWQEPL